MKILSIFRILTNNFTNTSTHLLLSTRHLGNAARGPTSNDVFKHWKYASKLFTERSLGYDVFKQRCESLRLFIFWGLVGALTIDLYVNPLKSTYWKKYSITNWPALWKNSRLTYLSVSDWSEADIEQSNEVWKKYLSISSQSSKE